MLFGGRKMKHKKQKKMKKAGRILLAVFAVVIGTLGVLLFTSERWMRKTWPNLSMEELVYQLKAPIAATSHDHLLCFVCFCVFFFVFALIFLSLLTCADRSGSTHPSDSGQHFSSGKTQSPCGVRADLYRGRSRQHRLFHQ